MNDFRSATACVRRNDMRSHRRLALALALSTVTISVAILLVPGYRWRQPPSVPRIDLSVRVVQPRPIEVPQAEPPIDPAESRPANAQEPVDDPAPREATVADDTAQDVETTNDVDPTIDWYAELEVAVRRSTDEAEESRSLSPHFDALRRAASRKFRKSLAPVRKPVWENVEKDLLGRTILRAGDCYRVLDDPSVANQWVQEQFTQYIVFCSDSDPVPKDLPFVAEVVARYAYLHPDDPGARSGASD